MKLLYLNHNFEGEGTFLRCYNFARVLSRRGYRIDLLCTRGGPGLPLIVKNPSDNLRVVTLPRLHMNASYFGYTVRSMLNSIAVSFKTFDVLHSFAVAIPATGIPTILCRFLRDKKIVVDWDDAWGDGLAGFASPIANRITHFLERVTPTLSKSRGLTVVSETLRERAKEFGIRTPIEKILNGADTNAIYPVERSAARAHLGIPPGETILMSMGRTYTKSFDILLSAFAGVLRKRPESKLYVVGKICEYGQLKRYIQTTKEKHTNILPSVVFTGGKPFDQLRYYLSSADVLVLPMEDCLHDRARFPIRFGDYLASGQPIVSNAVGEIKLLLDEHRAGLTTPPEDIGKFTEGILSLLDDRTAAREYGARARQLAEEKLNWDTLADQLHQVYQSLG
jgi:glycosyltransferase involved in cell wall biosynthesis